MSAFTKELLVAVSQSVSLLPLVTTATGTVITKTASAAVNGISAIDSLFAYGADYSDDIRQDSCYLFPDCLVFARVWLNFKFVRVWLKFNFVHVGHCKMTQVVLQLEKIKNLKFSI